MQKDSLYVRCSHCHKSRGIREARTYYVSCKHCYTYYCNRQCRHQEWERHRDRCSFARINTLCKEVIMKVFYNLFIQQYCNTFERLLHISQMFR